MGWRLFPSDAMTDDGRKTGNAFVLPTGTVSFLLTDVEGSTAAWERSGEQMPSAVRRHYELLDEAVVRHRGVRPVEQGEGDSVVAAFSRASDAVAAALDAQRALSVEPWPDGTSLRVRMAVHTGEAQLRDEGNYFGPTIIRCARIRAIGHGGQVLVSNATAALVADGLPDGAELIDLGAVRLKDLGRAERLWQLVHPDLERDFAPVRGLDQFAHNLPSQPSPLIGRVTEIDELCRLMDVEQLVTLTGSGGVGKTRLALAVGAEMIEHFAGGVWFVDLAVTGGTDTAARATLRALDVPETAPMAPGRQVALELAARGRALLLLDNCEHTLADSASFVAELTTSGARVAVLATSREPLGVPGEVNWRVPSLATPTIDQAVPIAALSAYEAVDLFLDRARRARPSFRIDDSNAASVAQICARLDGIPLAIELAAARCRHLSVERIRDGLDDRFGLLIDGSRVVLPRQQTLAASVEWSHDLLGADERIVLRRLGVFAGQFDLDAAEQVVSSLGQIDSITVFDVIAHLVDKSLILMADNGVGDARYRLLETIRTFARHQSGNAGEADSLRAVHAALWCERIQQQAIGGPTDAAVEFVEAHLDDLLAALDWLTRNDVRRALDVLVPLARALTGAGRAGQAMPTMQRLLDPNIEVDHPERWLRAAVSSCVPMGQFLGNQVFVDLTERAEILATELGDDYRLAVVRWARDMGLDTSDEMLAAAAGSDDPSVAYVTAIGTIRLAIDAALLAPTDAGDALVDAVRVADAYPSQYVQDYAVAARGIHGLLFGNLPETLRLGQQLRDARTPAMRSWAEACLLVGGILAGEADAISSFAAAALRDGERGIPEAQEAAELARAMVEVVIGSSDAVPAATRRRFPDSDRALMLIVGRIALASGDEHQARTIADQLAGSGPAHRTAHHITLGLLDDDEDAWHEALRIAAESGYRAMAADALEGLAVTATRADSSTEALRLLGAAERLRSETGYRFRFANEQRRIDDADALARADVGDTAADAALDEGRALDLDAATEYARRARGERKRPRHGWDSLTPTERRVVEAVADGLTNPEIADRLLMSRSTVKTHLEHVYTKTGFRNRAELTAEATRRSNVDTA